MRHEFMTSGKIILEKGALKRLGKDLEKLECNKVLIISSNSLVEYGKITEVLDYFKEREINFNLIDNVMPEPTAEHIQDIRNNLDNDYDLIIGIGGGSVLDTAKILSVLLTNNVNVEQIIGKDLIPNEGIKMILIPSTAGTGAEVTPNAIVTLPDKQLKESVISSYLYPDIVILDSEILSKLPQTVIAATGIDAFTHAIESYISNKSNKLSRIFSSESMKLISQSLDDFYDNPDEHENGEKMLVASMYGGMALSSAGTAAVHALAYPLGGTYGIAHGVANSMLLPHVMRFNFDVIKDELSEVGRIMGISEDDDTKVANSVIEQIQNWTNKFKIPQDLKEFGITESDIEELSYSASQITRLLDNNPKSLSLEDIKSIYRKLL